MKVALVLFDWFAHGGLQRDCRRIGESLHDKGAQVDVICMNCEGDMPAGMLLVQAKNASGNSVSARKQFLMFLERHLAQHDYDAVIGFNRLPYLDYYFAADTCFAWKATRERNFFYRWTPRSQQYLAFEKAVFGQDSNTDLFMLSPMQKNEYLACYPQSQSRMVDLPPGIARDRMAPDNAGQVRHEFRGEFAIGADELILLQVGTGYPVKGVDRSIRALASLPESIRHRTRLLLLGNDRQGRYAGLASRLGVADRITILSGRDDLPRFYQGADICLQPSQKESAGMVILEAIVAGLPVLATATCGYAFHVEQADAGVVLPAPFSQQSMNAALLEMLQGAERPRWRANGIAYGRAGNFYDMPALVAQMIVSGSRVEEDGD